MGTTIRYAGYPTALVYATPGKKPKKQLLWGDWVRVTDIQKVEDGYVQAHGRGVDGWMKLTDLQREPLLQIVFVDIGQGDGALVITPDDRKLVVDAGERDNMARFLKWKFNYFAKPMKMDAAVISHPDSDHYRGFDAVFDVKNLSFEQLFHNGIVERTGKNTLGRKEGSRPSYVRTIDDRAGLESFLSVKSRWKRKLYPTLLNKGLTNKTFDKFTAVGVEWDGQSPPAPVYLPGFAPGHASGLSIQILGPIFESDAKGRRLRWLKSKGKTKNGHSVVMKLVYGDVSVLLGGDLNIPSEELQLEAHTGLDPKPRSAEEEDALVRAARRVFRVDVAKACHHGSADVSTVFLRALDPIATVISSGDEEAHAHPRSDALGTIGKHSRGIRPLILSTELGRSTEERIKHPYRLRRELADLEKELLVLDRKEKLDAKQQKQRDRLAKQKHTILDVALSRSVATYGAIQLRSDGRRIVMAQKIERASKSKRWDLYKLEPVAPGELRYQSKYD